MISHSWCQITPLISPYITSSGIFGPKIQKWPPRWPRQTSAARNAPDWILNHSYRTKTIISQIRWRSWTGYDRICYHRRLYTCVLDNSESSGRIPMKLGVCWKTWFTFWVESSFVKGSPPLPREPTDFGGSDLWNKWFLNLPINNIETERYLKQRRCVVTKRPNCIPSSRHVHSSLKMINQSQDEDMPPPLLLLLLLLSDAEVVVAHASKSASICACHQRLWS